MSAAHLLPAPDCRVAGLRTWRLPARRPVFCERLRDPEISQAEMAGLRASKRSDIGARALRGTDICSWFPIRALRALKGQTANVPAYREVIR
jgi:hypothetical protein